MMMTVSRKQNVSLRSTMPRNVKVFVQGRPNRRLFHNYWKLTFRWTRRRAEGPSGSSNTCSLGTSGSSWRKISGTRQRASAKGAPIWKRSGSLHSKATGRKIFGTTRYPSKDLRKNLRKPAVLLSVDLYQCKNASWILRFLYKRWTGHDFEVSSTEFKSYG